MTNQKNLSLAKKQRLPRLARADREMLPAFRVTARDTEILKAVYTFRALTTAQIEALTFASNNGHNQQTKSSRCQYRLKLLYHYGYLAREEQPQKISEGKKPFVYMLDRPGAELVAERLGLEPEELDWKPGGNVVSSIFLEHLLSTNDVGVAVICAARRHQWTIREWRGEDVLKRPQMKDIVTLVGPQGGAHRAAVVPDAYFRLDIGEDIYNFFLELDRSTVTGQASKWGRRDWARKVKAYLAYCRTGKYEKRYKTADLRILTVTTSEKRLAHLKAITERVGGRGRFWFTTASLATTEDILVKPIWQITGHTGVYALNLPKSN